MGIIAFAYYDKPLLLPSIVPQDPKRRGWARRSSRAVDGTIANSVVRHAASAPTEWPGPTFPNFSKFPQFKLVAVAEVDLNRTVELKKKFPDVPIYQDGANSWTRRRRTSTR